MANITDENIDIILKHLNELGEIYGAFKTKLENKLSNCVDEKEKADLKLKISYYEKERKSVLDLIIDIVIV